MRSVLAIAAGFVVWSVIWVSAAAVAQAITPDSFRSDGAVQSAGLLLAFLAVAVVCSLAAGCTTATVSRDAAQRNVMILALILLAVGIAVEISGWALTPLWYHVTFWLLLVPATVAGGKLARK